MPDVFKKAFQYMIEKKMKDPNHRIATLDDLDKMIHDTDSDQKVTNENTDNFHQKVKDSLNHSISANDLDKLDSNSLNKANDKGRKKIEPTKILLYDYD